MAALNSCIPPSQFLLRPSPPAHAPRVRTRHVRRNCAATPAVGTTRPKTTACGGHSHACFVTDVPPRRADACGWGAMTPHAPEVHGEAIARHGGGRTDGALCWFLLPSAAKQSAEDATQRLHSSFQPQEPHTPPRPWCVPPSACTRPWVHPLRPARVTCSGHAGLPMAVRAGSDGGWRR